MSLKSISSALANEAIISGIALLLKVAPQTNETVLVEYRFKINMKYVSDTLDGVSEFTR